MFLLLRYHRVFQTVIGRAFRTLIGKYRSIYLEINFVILIRRTVCNSWGDPHVDGFDGARNDVYDANWYTLVEPTAEAQENDAVPYFRVSQDLIFYMI